ncbi:hypothetical protein V1264_024415 [Littorina saxatilis]|uniref:Amino acid transporter n=2 Tax=Littorina saxatilis TaxID=31220 RepID=A0AAN9ALG0_9CAEN
MGLRAVVYYMTTTLLAVILGIILVVTIKPGTKDQSKETSNRDEVSALATFLNLVRNLFPDNMVEMCFRKKVPKMMKNLATNETYSKVVTGEGTNMLGVVSVSIMIAACINHIGEKAEALLKLFEAINEVSIILVTAFIWYSPIGVLFLVMSEVIKQEDPRTAFSKLAFYCLTVLLGLGLHGFITLPLTYYAIIRKNPFKFIKGMLPAMLTALATASSLATLPVTMRNLEINNKVDPRVIAFVAPVGANINMDGTALYEAVAVIFIGQTVGKEMDFVKVLTISVTATAAAIGAAGVPQAGLVTMVIVLTAVGFPVDGIGLILSVDWFLDRFRTSINILGDAFGAAVVHALSLKDLERMDLEDQLRAQKTALEALQNTYGDHRNSSTHTGTTMEYGGQDTTVSNYCPPPLQPGSGLTVEQAESDEGQPKRFPSTAVDFHGDRSKGTPQGEENAAGGAAEQPTHTDNE